MSYDNFAKAYLKMLQESTEYLAEDILMEDRIDYLKKNTKPINTAHDTFAVHRNNNDIIDFLANNADPSRNKVYTQHLIKMYHGGAFRQEDSPRVREAVNNFDKYKSKLDPEQRDIKKYSRISDIESAVAPHIGTGATKAEEKSILKSNLHIPGKHDLKYDDANISIYHIKDKETSQKLYAQQTANKPGVFPTEWCTAFAPPREHNAFDEHNAKGNLFVVHRKSDGAVFQYHPATDQFMNVNDDTINKTDLDSIQSSLHKAWSLDHTLLDLHGNGKLSTKHSSFLGKYALPDEHYSFDDSPIAYLKSNKSTLEHIDKALNNIDWNVRKAAASHPNATKENIDKALNDKESYVRVDAASHLNATKENLDKALGDNAWVVRKAAIENPKSTKEHLDRAMTDDSWSVREVAAKNINATKEHLDKALNDTEPYVRIVATKNANATKEHLDKALNDSDWIVRSSAINNPNSTKEHLDKGLTDSNVIVRATVVENPNTTKEHLIRGLADPENRVRKAALQNPNYKKYFPNGHEGLI